MIQDIAPRQFDNQYKMREPDAESRIMLFSGNGVYIKSGADAGASNDALDFLRYREFPALCDAIGLPAPEPVYLFSVGEESYFLAGVPHMSPLSKEPGAGISPSVAEMFCLQHMPMFTVRSMQPKWRVFAASTAWHLYCWYRDSRFCGRCGGKTRHSGKMRAMECPSCGNLIFPKIAPAVIVGVTDNDQLLMTKYAGRAYKNYALIAGFVEIGETAEQTVRREVAEEVGLQVKNIRYYKSQPWGFDSNLLLGYYCELDGADGIVLDKEELSTAEWVDYRDIPDDVEGLSLTREMMTAFREECRLHGV